MEFCTLLQVIHIVYVIKIGKVHISKQQPTSIPRDDGGQYTCILLGQCHTYEIKLFPTEYIPYVVHDKPFQLETLFLWLYKNKQKKHSRV